MQNTKKIQTLQKIVKEYSRYFRYFDDCDCYVSFIFASDYILRYYNDNKKQIIITDNEMLSRPYKMIKAPTICIHFTNNTNKRAFESLKRYIPIVYIDTTIKRYRAKLFNEIKKEEKKIFENWVKVRDYIFNLKMTQ